uniref:NTF2-related export protein n=1 Tax=Sinocyclocheilus rhinocerous TaxID=307959 RepID=A0A673G903_9TELE
MASTVDFRTLVDQSCRYSDEFVNIYYDCMDKRRRNLTRLYLDKATLVWNGNAVTGHDALSEFFESLPSSEFQVQSLDCQPVHEQATQGQMTLLVVTAGSVKFDGNNPYGRLQATAFAFKTGQTELQLQIFCIAFFHFCKLIAI